MNDSVRRDVGELLALQLDQIQDDLDARARPYRENAELRRRLNIALTYAEELPCTCNRLILGDRFICARHDLETILSGDV